MSKYRYKNRKREKKKARQAVAPSEATPQVRPQREIRHSHAHALSAGSNWSEDLWLGNFWNNVVVFSEVIFALFVLVGGLIVVATFYKWFVNVAFE